MAASPPSLAAAMGLMLAVASVGCTVQMCNDEISSSGRYQATIVDIYDTQTMYPG